MLWRSRKPEPGTRVGSSSPRAGMGTVRRTSRCLQRSERAALALVREVVVTSPTTAKLVASDYGVSAGTSRWQGPAAILRRGLRGSRSEMPHLLSVGAVVPRKGFDVLVAALATFAELPWQLTIAGDLTRDPNEAARLDASISQHRLAGRIETLGAVSSERLAALYNNADLFVLASRFEGYGMAYAEALSHGLPVIGTTAGAIPDTVPQAAGLLVTSGDVDALAKALRRVIADAELRRRLSEAASERRERCPPGSNPGQSSPPRWRSSHERLLRGMAGLAGKL